MAVPETLSLPADAWTLVLSGVTSSGIVYIVPVLNDAPDPTSFLATFVNAGDPAPAVDFDGGIPFEGHVFPSSPIAIDVYLMPVNYAGRVVRIV